MVKVLESTDQRVILRGVSWKTYECLLADHQDRRVPRLAYDGGMLEIMSPSAGHEVIGRMTGLLVNIVAEEQGIDVVDTGSTTFKREDLQRGFEPDGSFYVRNEGRIRGKSEINMTADPPPDLVIEIDVTSYSLDKLPIYAQVGVPEVWRHDGARFQILRFEGAEYVEAAESGVLPSLNAAVLTGFVAEGRTMTRTAWLRRVRAWARQQGGQRDDADR